MGGQGAAAEAGGYLGLLRYSGDVNVCSWMARSIPHALALVYDVSKSCIMSLLVWVVDDF